MKTTTRLRSSPARRALFVLAAIVAVFVLPLAYAVSTHYSDGPRATDWRTARRDSTGIAPDPARTDEAIIHVYVARAFRWRGAFGVHSWIAAKPQRASAYTRFEVMGFGVARGAPAVRVAPGVPDGHWFGSPPTLIRALRGGAEVDALIARLHAAAAAYPHNHEYRIWPGPNSNTFIAHLGRAVPELKLHLPPTAIGKDYLPGGAIIARAPSGAGVQVSLGGLLGITIAPEEGFELNLLGLSAGIAPWPPTLKLPGIGALGFAASGAASGLPRTR
ncbi:MAG TPA: DUF3750 domain-containing protein [Rhodocyclaceae bacterium]|nr:DUF3750 domain-containing protein [Rhodocyclaceae bacterium]